MKVSLVAAIVIFLSAPLGAQWLTYRTPGLPRLADGKPNLAVPAPRTPEGKPDLSGLWQRIESKYAENLAADLKPGEVLTWAPDLAKDRVANLSKHHVSGQYVPWGPNNTNSARMTKIVQTSNLIVMLDEGLAYRQILTDGHPLETDPNPNWKNMATASSFSADATPALIEFSLLESLTNSSADWSRPTCRTRSWNRSRPSPS